MKEHLYLADDDWLVSCPTRHQTKSSAHTNTKQVLRLRANLFFGNVGSFRQASGGGR
jgi:hypothetical protein